MNLKKEELDVIEQMASLFMSIEDIAVNLNIDIDELKHYIALKSGNVFIAFKKGIITTELQLRTAIKQAALNGSNPAQQQMLELLRKLNTEI